MHHNEEVRYEQLTEAFYFFESELQRSAEHGEALLELNSELSENVQGLEEYLESQYSRGNHRQSQHSLRSAASSDSPTSGRSDSFLKPRLGANKDPHGEEILHHIIELERALEHAKDKLASKEAEVSHLENLVSTLEKRHRALLDDDPQDSELQRDKSRTALSSSSSAPQASIGKRLKAAADTYKKVQQDAFSDAMLALEGELHDFRTQIVESRHQAEHYKEEIREIAHEYVQEKEEFDRLKQRFDRKVPQLESQLATLEHQSRVHIEHMEQRIQTVTADCQARILQMEESWYMREEEVAANYEAHSDWWQEEAHAEEVYVSDLKSAIEGLHTEYCRSRAPTHSGAKGNVANTLESVRVLLAQERSETRDVALKVHREKNEAQQYKTTLDYEERMVVLSRKEVTQDRWRIRQLEDKRAEVVARERAEQEAERAEEEEVELQFLTRLSVATHSTSKTEVTEDSLAVEAGGVVSSSSLGANDMAWRGSRTSSLGAIKEGERGPASDSAEEGEEEEEESEEESDDDDEKAATVDTEVPEPPDYEAEMESLRILLDESALEMAELKEEHKEQVLRGVELRAQEEVAGEGIQNQEKESEGKREAWRRSEEEWRVVSAEKRVNDEMLRKERLLRIALQHELNLALKSCGRWVYYMPFPPRPDKPTPTAPIIVEPLASEDHPPSRSNRPITLPPSPRGSTRGSMPAVSTDPSRSSRASLLAQSTSPRGSVA